MRRRASVHSWPVDIGDELQKRPAAVQWNEAAPRWIAALPKCYRMLLRRRDQAKALEFSANSQDGLWLNALHVRHDQGVQRVCGKVQVSFEIVSYLLQHEHVIVCHFYCDPHHFFSSVGTIVRPTFCSVQQNSAQVPNAVLGTYLLSAPQRVENETGHFFRHEPAMLLAGGKQSPKLVAVTFHFLGYRVY